jgi:hypothetical protein
MCSRAKAAFRLMPSQMPSRSFAQRLAIVAFLPFFATLNPLKLQCRRSYFPLFSNLRAITLRLHKKPASGAG